MEFVSWRRISRVGVMILAVGGWLGAGCTSQSRARTEARDAYLAGQNAALLQAQSLAGAPGITVIGPVQNRHIPWIAGMTLLQALATANYLDDRGPKEIIITREGESATLKPDVLFNGAVVPLEAGDVIELR
jgi:hypothetical protein